MTRQMPSKTIDDYAARILSDYQVPGMALAIVKDDALLYARGYGVLQSGEPPAVDIHTSFGIASISKSFTAMALGILVDEEKLNWSDRVANYLPNFRLQDPFADREFTVLDLLLHRSGLPEVSGGTLWYGSKLSREEVIAQVRCLRPVTSFRSTYAYQNITYLVAGQLIPAICGMSWDAFVKKRIFQPSGMQHSDTSIEQQGIDHNFARPHVLQDGRIMTVDRRSYNNAGPAASINTTVSDLAQYARLLMNGGRINGQTIYSSKIAQDLWTPHTVVPIPEGRPEAYAVFSPRHLSAYALGWFIQDIPRFREVKIFHSGGIDGLRSRLTIIPEQNLAVIVLANNEGPAPVIMSEMLFDLYWGDEKSSWYHEALLEWQKEQEKRKDGTSTAPLENTRPSLPLQQYAATYSPNCGGEMRVSWQDGSLLLTFAHNPSFTARLTHWHYDTFSLDWLDPVIPAGKISFILDSSANVVEARIDQPKLLDVDFSELNPIIHLDDQDQPGSGSGEKSG